MSPTGLLNIYLVYEKNTDGQSFAYSEQEIGELRSKLSQRIDLWT